jgi:hypothetical protein
MLLGIVIGRVWKGVPMVAVCFSYGPLYNSIRLVLVLELVLEGLEGVHH